MKLRKFLSILTLVLSNHFFFYANPQENVKEYTLENNMKIYLLEDTSDALVHTEYTCRAGFSSQTVETNGWFKLFTRLVKAANPKLDFLLCECNSDSSRYVIETAPQQTEYCLELLSNAVFAPSFSDEVFNAELKNLKNEVTVNAKELSTYINAAIDSRVFSESPWKHDSGIYPSIFRRTSTMEARNHIKEIGERWYTPQNSALFVTGNFNSEKLLLAIKNTFGTFYSNYKIPGQKPSLPVNSHKKYVFNHKEVSADLTQIVVQYTMLESEECDLLSAILNNDSSTFKKRLLDLPQLNIPGAEYINVSSAHKKDSSRLIIQALMQPVKDKKSEITSLKQAELFLETIKNFSDFLSPEESLYGKIQLEKETDQVTGTPLQLMYNLSSYWALEPYSPYSENDSSYSNLVFKMMDRKEKIKEIENENLIAKLQAENPFVFVIINSKDYKANQKSYKNNDYEEINENNSSWYLQNYYKEVKEQLKPNDEIFYDSSKTDDNAYFKRNLDQIKTFTLENGIEVISKKNTNSSDISMILSVKGGKFNSAQNNGLEEVMINLMAGIIQKELNEKENQGLITGNTSVTAKSNYSTSTILINFDMQDAEIVIKTAATSIIYGQIAPSSADRAVSSRQYKKRLENGSASNQLFSAAINPMYGKGDFAELFECKNDILLSTDYTQILNSYPGFLDAGRYSIIITGNFDDSIFPFIENAFNLFANNHENINTPQNLKTFPKNKRLVTEIQHTFLTDIPAEKAGPQPKVLIPTTEFLDPVLYVTKAPENGSKEAALFNAILNYFQTELDQAVKSNSKFTNSSVNLLLPQSKMNFACIYIMNVSHTKEADSVYRKTMQNLLKEMQKPSANKEVIQKIKSCWTLKQLGDTFTNSGSAYLMQKGLELFPEKSCPDFYLQEYNYIQTASVEDYLSVMENIPDFGDLRVYSKDGRN